MLSSPGLLLYNQGIQTSSNKNVSRNCPRVGIQCIQVPKPTTQIRKGPIIMVSIHNFVIVKSQMLPIFLKIGEQMERYNQGIPCILGIQCIRIPQNNQLMKSPIIMVSIHNLLVVKGQMMPHSREVGEQIGKYTIPRYDLY